MQKILLLLFAAVCLNSAHDLVLSELRLSDPRNDGNLTDVFKSSIISEKEFQIYENSLLEIQNSKCRKDLNETLWGIVEGLPWAVAMYDSSVKVPVGVESGSVYQFGNFDECVNSADLKDDDGRPSRITPKYCLADVHIEGLIVRSLITRNSEQTNATKVHWAVCVPSSCLTEDVEVFMENILGHVVHVEESMCHVNKPFTATTGMIAYGCVILCFIMLTLFGTSYHVYLIFYKKPLKEKSGEYFEMIMKSFSVIENMKKLFQKSHDHLGLNALNGIKAIFMLLVILGHSCLFIIAGPITNSDFYTEAAKKIRNAFMLNSILYVDTFLLLSGFLFCRILLMELERRRGRVNVLLLYIFRYIRLTPAYFAVIAFYMTWFPHTGSGPLWNSKIGLEQERCQKSWWLNLLYVNNYVGNDTLCMFQSWYLSVDTQLYIIAPAAIYLLWKSRKLGIWFLSGLAAIASALPFIITYTDNLDPTLFVYADELEDISSNKFFINTYIKTHMRATGYVAGLLTGFILHYIQEKRIEIPRKVVNVLWIASTIMGVTSMFSVTVFYVRPYTLLESALYAGLHRLGWSLATGWLVIATTTGNAGVLKRVLSSRFFAPLSRLTYCAYLTNGLVELHQIGTLRSPLYLNYVNLFGIPMAHSVYTFVTSVVLCLLFESPIHGIEKILLKNEGKRRQQVQQQKDNHTPSTSEETA